MKYNVSQLPNTGKALQFKVKSIAEKKETAFSFCKELLTVWGNPVQSKLKEVMVAYIKRNGWSKEMVSISGKNTLPNLNTYVASLPKSK